MSWRWTLEPATLPEPMRDMTPEQRKAHVETQAVRRGQLRQQIAELAQARSDYLADQAAKRPSNTLGAAMTAAVRDQVERAGYEPAAR